MLIVDGYKGRLSDSYGKLIQTTTMIIAFGTFVSVYSNNNDTDRNSSKGVNYRPSMEAILNDEERLFENNFSKKTPGDRNKLNGSNGNHSFNSYNGKRNM